MRLSVDRLVNLSGLDLELPAEDGNPDRVKLSNAVNFRGTYAQSADEIRLESMAADELDASSIRYHLSQSESLSAAPLTLRGVELDCRLARGPLKGRLRFGGRIASREVSGKALAIHLGKQRVSLGSAQASAVVWSHAHGQEMLISVGELALATIAAALGSTNVEAAQVVIRGLNVGRGAAGHTRVEAAAIEVTGAHLALGGLAIVARAIAAKGVNILIDASSLRIQAASVSLHDLEVQSGDLKVHVARAELASGVLYEDGRLSIGHVASTDIAVHAASLGSKQEPPLARDPASRTAPLDLRFLDGLTGRLHADVTVDAKVAIIKRRVATHKIRLSIDGGIIDFKELERGLSLLEDAVIDFEFEGDQLILEKDLPLIPFDNETLVSWHLDEEGKSLAATKRVRLRTLAFPRIPEKAPKSSSEKKPGFELTRLDIDPIETTLSISGGHTFTLPGLVELTLGAADGRPTLGELRLAGALRYRTENPDEPGQVEASVDAICAAIGRLRVGARSLSVGALTVATATDVRVGFLGFRPAEARALVRGLVLENLSLA